MSATVPNLWLAHHLVSKVEKTGRLPKDRLHKDGLTQSTIVERLKKAADAMEFVGK